jgi:hypothetical protein
VKVGFELRTFSILGQNNDKGGEVMSINFAVDGLKCSHLKGKKIQTCTVKKKKYIPSLFELEEYCHTEKYVRCPLLVMKPLGRSIQRTGRGKDLVPA